MKHVVGLLLALLLPVLALAADEVPPEYLMTVNGTIEIAPDGSVRSYMLDKGPKPAVAQMIESAVQRWQFEPIVVDGQPANAKTQLRIELEALPVGDSYALRVKRIQTGQPQQRANMKPPRYPEVATRARLAARVLLGLKLDAEGRVIQTHVYQTSLGARTHSEHAANAWRREFEQASVRAAKSWSFDLTEQVNGRTIGTVVLVPIVFAMATDKNRWLGFEPGPFHEAPWSSSQDLANIDTANLGEGDYRVLDSRVRLKDDVVGKTL